MWKYILKRLLIMIPTLFGISLVVFAIVNLAPGGPVEQKLQQLRFAGAGGGEAVSASSSSGTSTVSAEVLAAIKKQYGFDKPIHMRYILWLKNLAKFDFGESFTYEEPVVDVIMSKFPVSLQFGVISLILSYLISIPLGIMMAVKKGEVFDKGATAILFVMYSIPPLMLGIIFIVFLAGESFLDLFPIGGVYSDMYDELSFFEQIGDRIHHFILPLICYTINSYTVLTMLMKNSLLDEIKKDYIRTARAKGLSEKVVVFKHGLRNALIPIVTGIGGFLGVFFAGSIIIEQIFQLDGMGLLSFSSVLSRDYNVLMGLIVIQSLLMLVGNIISDIAYVFVDPRIDFK
jgi:microcin C transport system permease protein